MSDRKRGIASVETRIVLEEGGALGPSARMELRLVGDLWMPLVPHKYEIDGKTTLGIQCCGMSLRSLLERLGKFESTAMEAVPSRKATRVDSGDSGASAAVDPAIVAALAAD